tara:strand:- start:30 stop:1439 length:1410 start_codon:yes stop_codon:yes gene_type:complete
MPSSQSPDAPRPHVLVVDDEDGMRHMLTLLLQKEGYEVSEAHNGIQALEQLNQFPIDVVLTDLKMPQLGGLGLIRRIHELQLPVVVIIMSAFIDLDAAIEAVKMGAVDYVSKPFRADEVLLKLEMALEKERLVEERKRLQEENQKLRWDMPHSRKRQKIVGKSKAFTEIWRTIEKIAKYKSTVLLVGESGTGKEVLAQALHRESERRNQSFVPINCGAIPESLLESELFGHRKGSFTHATRDKLGLVEEAHQGTLFLDEVGELPMVLQVKLLRFLQEDEIRRVGDTKSIQVNVRVVAATSKNLEDMVKAGTFREDLYYRLNVLQLDIPALRHRKEDIPLLVEFFAQKIARQMERSEITFSRPALKALLDYHWPGNIRELENTLERTIVLSDTDHIDLRKLPPGIQTASPTSPLDILANTLSIKEATRLIEKELITRSLEKTGGNRTHAAKLLEISHRSLLYKIKEYDLG